MFIVFEGIDGSGKTTLSNRVAQRLVRLGHKVVHAREKGELQSATARRIRELTRDSQLLEMSPRAELFLNLARDTQQLEEVIRPALERKEICIADRFLYSQLALAAAGRGLPEEEVRAALSVASQGVWPDLVVLVDVEPELARLRKRLGRLLGGRENQPESRKGLAGAGLLVRIRQAFLGLARREPWRWQVFDNTRKPLWALEQEITDAVLARLEGRTAQPSSPALGRSSTEPTGNGTSSDPSEVEPRFFAALDELEPREPELCAYLLVGIPGLPAHRRRLSYAERFPRLVAMGVAGRQDRESAQLRMLLAERAPREVAAGLAGDASGEAMELRWKLFALAPAEALEGLKRLDSDEAWALRERGLAEGRLEEVLPSLAGLEGERAFRLRDQGLEQKLALPLAKSLVGLVGERADSMRQELFLCDRLSALRSGSGLETPYLREIRERLFPLAMKPVLRSLTGVAQEYAYALRERAAPLTKEALDSVDGMEEEAAWSLRERFWSSWPATAVSSMRQLGDTERGRELMKRVLSRFPDRIAVLRNAYACLAKAEFEEPRRRAVAAEPAEEVRGG